MLILFYASASIIGLFIGSFYTATSHRVLYYFYGPGRKKEDRWGQFFTRRSFCMECGKPVHIADLIPLVGYLRLKGRCRECGSKIGGLTLFGELFPGILLPFLLFTGFSWPAAFFTTLVCGHLYISLATDYNFFQLDYENTLFVFIFGTAAAYFQANGEVEPLLIHLYTFAGTSGIFLLLFLLGRGKGLGFGDVLLAASIALTAGFPWMLVLIQLAAAGSILYIYLVQKNAKAPAPLGVFLSLALFITLLLRGAWNIYESGGTSAVYFP